MLTHASGCGCNILSRLALLLGEPMAHPEQTGFIRLIRDLVFPYSATVLEIGSYQVNDNGSLRSILSGCSYTGVDLVEGPGVDIVASGHEINLTSDSFDVTLSAECFEHNPLWRETFVNMYRMTKPGGVLIITCASRGRVEHGTARSVTPHYSPGTTAVGWDYYMNLAQDDFERAFNISGMFSDHHFYVVKSSHDLYFFGIKRGGVGPVFDAVAIRQGVDKLENLRTRNAARMVVRAPLDVLSRVLPERKFQNIAVPYSKAMYRMANAVKMPLWERPSSEASRSCPQLGRFRRWGILIRWGRLARVGPPPT
jgi:SAM-dependent methyltransferase